MPSPATNPRPILHALALAGAVLIPARALAEPTAAPSHKGPVPALAITR